MLRTTSDYFRQFACFSAFLVLNGSLLELRGQDTPQGVIASAASGPVRSGARPTPGTVTSAPNAGSTFRQRAVPASVPATGLPAVSPVPAGASPMQKLQQLWPGMSLPVAPGMAGAILSEAVKDVYAAMPLKPSPRRRLVLTEAA